MTDHILAGVQDAATLKHQYIRNTRDARIYKVTDVGTLGVTVYEADEYAGKTYGPEILLTWRAFKHIYAIMVHAAEIDTKELH